MKRWIAFVTVLALAMGMTACAGQEAPNLADKLNKLSELKSQETEEPKEQNTPQTQKPEKKPEVQEEPEIAPVQLGGTYRAPEKGSEGEETYVEIRAFPGFVVLEYFHVYEGSTFSFWVEEFWPDETCEVGVDTVLTGKSQEFSIMSKGNEYWMLPRNRTITATEDGLRLQYEGYDQEIYVRDDTFADGHTDRQTMQEQLASFASVEVRADLVGEWMFWDGWYVCGLRLSEDGGFTLFSKEPGFPVHLLEGIWGIDGASGKLQIMAEMAGEGRQPFIHQWDWRLDEDGMLYLTEDEPYLLPEYPDGVSFWTWDEYSELPMTQTEALGYVVPWYDLDGEYEDQYGYDYYYHYRIPQLLEVEGDAAVINQEILDMFEPVVEEQQEIMEQQEIIDCDLVEYQIYVTEGILTVYVYSISYQENEQHKTWYYDLDTGKRTDAKEMLRRVGISEEEFLQTVREAAEQYYVEAFSMMPEADREEYGYYERLEWTRSDEAVNLDLPVYVDRAGNICVYGRIGSIAGAGEMWVPLYPFAEWQEWDTPVG